MRVALLGFWLLLTLIPPMAARAQSSGLEVSDPSALGVGVAGIDDRARAIGLSIQRLRDAVDAMLWRNGIEKDRIAAEPLFLGVRVHVLGDAFVVSLEFHRWVGYQVAGAGHKTSAIVWRRERTGAHSGNADIIVTAATGLVEEFLREYLNANRDRF